MGLEKERSSMFFFFLHVGNIKQKATGFTGVTLSEKPLTFNKNMFKIAAKLRRFFGSKNF